MAFFVADFLTGDHFCAVCAWALDVWAVGRLRHFVMMLLDSDVGTVVVDVIYVYINW